jgi:hypothetical protein
MLLRLETCTVSISRQIDTYRPHSASATRFPHPSDIDEPPGPFVSVEYVRDKSSIIVRRNTALDVFDLRKKLYHICVVRHDEAFRHCIDVKMSPIEKFLNSLHDVSAAQRRARDRMLHGWAHYDNVLDLINMRPAHEGAFSVEQAEDFIADVGTLSFCYNAQVI